MDFIRQKRLVYVFFIFALCLSGLVYQLWNIQIRDGHQYAFMALEQGSSWVSLEDIPRGRILDRNMRPLTGEKIEERLILFPSAIKDKEGAGEQLAAILGVDRLTVDGYLAGGPVCLPYQLDAGQITAIQAVDWSGVMVLPVELRYGDRPLAAQTVGHLGKIFSMEEFTSLSGQSSKLYRYYDLVGKTGLEKYYEEELKGRRPQRAVRVFADARGRLLGGPGFELEEMVADVGRCDLVLTIDSEIQKIVEEIMDRRIAKGAVVVMEAKTGDILALAGRPGYNPAQPGLYLKNGLDESYYDRCTALYQPGSIFKTVVAAAAIEVGLAKHDTHFHCQGQDGKLIRCNKPEGHGDIDFARAFSESCNHAFAETGLKLTAEKIIEYSKLLGLDDQTIIGYPVPNDRRQNLNLIAEPYNLVNSSIGQGPVLTTPVQVASMINTIVSDGIHRTPRLVKELRQSSSGIIIREFPFDQGKAVLSESTSKKVRELLNLVTSNGAGRDALVPVYGSAGKTGTAQVGNGKLNAWFAGYAPDKHPRYIITVLVEEGDSGAKSAAPVFREIMEQVLVYDKQSSLTK